ncbi:MAG: hypothetical protein R3286_12500 [Gammaproteobacteria bacterium]|nr:hypothetical protein [Gammaproteobacteria bacterium]
MRHHVVVLLASMLCLTLAGPARGQEMTERYIPIGQSPGLSGTASTDVGTITAYDPASRVLKVDARSGPQSVEVTQRTRIWIDRSRAQLTNLDGSTADLAAGRRVEIKYADAGAKRNAEWIKVEMAN